MKKHFKYLFFLILGLCCFVASTIIQHDSTRVMARLNQAQETAKMQSQINKILNETKLHADVISQIIVGNANLSFSLLLSNTPYPYYIYKDNRLFFWSTNKFIPDNSIVTDTATFSYWEHKQSKFIKYATNYKGDKNEFKLVFLIPLFSKSNIQNDYISSSLNQQIFNPKLEINLSATGENKIIAPDKSLLFSVQFEGNEYWYSTIVQQFILMLTLLYLSCFTILGGLIIQHLLREKHYQAGLFSLALLILSIRGIMLLYGFPFSIIALDLFNSKYFASSIISPSLGDFILNAIGIIIFALFFYKYSFKLNFVKYILKSNKKRSYFISILLVVCSQMLYGLIYSVFKILNLHSQWIFDITYTIHLNYFRLLSLLTFILLCIAFFCINHFFVRLFLALNNNKPKQYFILIGIGTIVAPLIFYEDKNFYWPLLLTNAIFIAIQYRLHMPRFLSKIRYSSYVYLISVSMMCALAGALAISQVNTHRNAIEKNKFASQIIIESDVLEEYLLNDINEKIRNDVFIKNVFTSPLASKDLIFQKIRRVFLANYFEKFDIKISIYNQFGETYFAGEDYLQYNEAVKRLAKRKNATEYRNVFFISDAEMQDLPRYVVFNKVEKNRAGIGYVLIQLTSKKIIPYSVFPELLIDKKYRRLTQPKTYSYATFLKKEMKSNYGVVNYEKNFSKISLDNPLLYTEGITQGIIHHWGLKDLRTGSTIVVSSLAYTWKNVFSNFSFFFIVFLLLISSYLLTLRLFFTHSQSMISYASKIQLYLNVAFFLPLFVIAVTTLSVISGIYQNNLNESFTKKAENIANRVSIFFEDFKKEKIKKENLNTFIFQISKYTESDINFFGTNGVLVATNQPNIFQKALLSYYINPEALSEIKERKNSIVMLTEKVGNLNYHSVYVAVKAYDSGQLMGIVSIPFFESKQEVEKQMIEIFTTIINIFSSIFLIFLVLSYIVSKALTIPLKLITHNIKKTTFGDTNEAIQWSSQDEIGLLVGEYNAMLKKLEVSKEALKNNEKENAWREMAQQVAHEIKNPLTPMKLTIQYLTQNILSKQDPAHEKISKGLATILTQIDTLNEIATSFSSFAKMPLPKNEVFEIFPLLQQSANLFHNTVASVATVSLPNVPSTVLGDPRMMNGIFSNILLNAVQSIPADRTPEILIKGEIIEDKILIEIRDNGSGIPEELHHKVFVPHFSTKYTGSGIGLALAKQGVDFIGGKIWFKTGVDTGTSFFIELPFAAAAIEKQVES